LRWDLFFRPLPLALFGAVEQLVGLWILFGIFPREIILIAWIPINLISTVFNWTELIGHLPIYGTLAILLVWSLGSKNLALWLSGLREGSLAILGNDGGGHRQPQKNM